MHGTRLANANDMDEGMLVGRFQILARVAAGGMGTVYRARDTITDQDVALKVLNAESDGWRFTRETRIASTMEHPCIVGYAAHGETASGVQYLALEWLDGEDLETRLERGPLPLDEALAIIRRVSRALHHLHAAGVVHRDIKPANIFLCDKRADRCRVLDFGVARVLGPDDGGIGTGRGIVVGTPLYMAPEQALGNDLTASSDVHALGNVLFECLTGRAPFDAATLPAIILRIVGETAPLLSRNLEVPPALDALCARLLAKDPNARPPASTVCALLDDIEASQSARDDQTLRGVRVRPAISASAYDWVDQTVSR